MKIFPIIPIWIMIIICTALIIFIIKKNNKNIIQIIIVILLFIINLRIMIPNNNSQVLTNNLDVLFVIDNTISMNAEDYNGNNTRLSAIKQDCKYIVEKLSGARFSVITFNNTAKIMTPYTKDTNITIETVDIIEPIDELYAKGSSLNTPLDTMISSLKSSQKKENRIRILFFISDGEITDDSSLKSFSEVSKYIDNGAVMGYGTNKGGYMKTKNKYSESEDYIIDYTNYNYNKAISKIDENNLQKIAKDINVEYIHMERQVDINRKLDEIKRLTTSNIDSSDKSTYDDTYYIFVIPLLVLLTIELNNLRRKVI